MFISYEAHILNKIWILLWAKNCQNFPLCIYSSILTYFFFWLAIDCTKPFIVDFVTDANAEAATVTQRGVCFEYTQKPCAGSSPQVTQ